MKNSYYNIFLQNRGRGRFFIYNTFIRKAIKLEKEMFELLLNQKLNQIDENLLKDMNKLGILYNNGSDEKEYVLDYLKKTVESASALYLTIVMTRQCNLNCAYCIQTGIERSNESIDVAALIEWIKFRIEKFKSKKIKIDFFGGEPLLEKEKILRILSGLSKYLIPHNVKFSFDIVTNGTLICRNFIEKIMPYGLNLLVVTIDGSPEIHDKKRVYANGGPSFNIILKNLVEIKDIARLHINVNVDKTNNIEDISKLLKILKENGLHKSIERMDFKPVVNNKINECGVIFFKNANLEKLINFRKLARLWGFKIFNQPVFGPCDIYFKNAFTIDANGDIYKCSSLIGNKDYVVGSIYNNVSVKIRYFKISSDKVCLSCKFLPICYSGCRYASFLKTGDMEKVHCEKEFYENFLHAIYS